MAGYNGKILRVDLTANKTWVEEKDDLFYRTYWGGRGLVAYYLLTELPPGADPLGPENVLVFAAGPLTGAPVAGDVYKRQRFKHQDRSSFLRFFLDDRPG